MQYLEEEAVKTYTHAIEDLDAGKLPQWQSERAPQVCHRVMRSVFAGILRRTSLAFTVCVADRDRVLADASGRESAGPATKRAGG